ncbi:MAG: hypothetical protein ACHQKY_06410 [Terriglobia bacterium]
MSIVAALLLPIIVISHLIAQWYLFRFIGYHAFGWMRASRKEGRPLAIRHLFPIPLSAAFRRLLLWGGFISLFILLWPEWRSWLG